MPGKISAGILLFRKHGRVIEIFLVHPGGPYWKNKDEGAWSVPKGEVHAELEQDHEDQWKQQLLETAKREFQEETSVDIMQCIHSTAQFKLLSPVKQKSGKTVYAFAVEGDIDAKVIVSNTCMIEWPPRSGKQIEIPEVDCAEWFSVDEARKKINPAQAALIEEVS